MMRRYFSQRAADRRDHAEVDEPTMSVTDGTMRIQEADSRRAVVSGDRAFGSAAKQLLIAAPAPDFDTTVSPF